ncbi:tRNA (cytosine(32)/uridine(32)-2'-O)-methyltransferase TrmJ [Dasania marina]|uniref:tRNA (cytosine(32)/uridine(32)-2'-O)-methyltransferase TrmJ n=1 Tax=Dasania marina TaxID=471499 RepID=UPI0003829EBE
MNKGKPVTDTPSNTPSSTPSPLDNVRIVLVNTTHPGNIGAVARAMKNMGLSKLYLVEPKNYPDEVAYYRAVSAQDVLNDAVITSTLEEAIADCGLVVGTSARGRRIPWPLLNPRTCAEQAYPELSQHPVAIVFGREDRGLTNDELQCCNLHVHIPTNEDYSSLNLAMAVQVLSYEMRMAHLSADEQRQSEMLSTDPMKEWDAPLSKSADMERFFVHLESTLRNMGFLKPSAPKQLMTRLRRLFTRTRMDELEVNMMRGVLTSAQRWVEKAGGPEPENQDKS